jgi:MFS family permease
VDRNAIAGGNTLGPLICGFIVTDLSWRWHKWIAVIFTTLNFVAIVLFVPETRFRRDGGKTEQVTAQVEVEKIIGVDMKSIRRTSDDSVAPVPKKGFVEELSLWSGSPETNLFKMFLRYVFTSTNLPCY